MKIKYIEKFVITITIDWKTFFSRISLFFEIINNTNSKQIIFIFIEKNLFYFNDFFLQNFRFFDNSRREHIKITWKFLIIDTQICVIISSNLNLIFNDIAHVNKNLSFNIVHCWIEFILSTIFIYNEKHISLTTRLTKFHRVKFVNLISNRLCLFIDVKNNYSFYQKIWFEFSKFLFLFFYVRKIVANYKTISNVFWFVFYSLKEFCVFIDHALKVNLN